MRAEIPNIDIRAYMKAHKKSIEDQLIKAARAFVLAAYPHVPVETGMSRGSFLKLAKKVGVSVPIVPKKYVTVTKTYKTKSGIKTSHRTIDISKKRYFMGVGRPTLPKNKHTGSKLSTYEMITNTKRIRFMFQTKVYQYNLLDEPLWQSFRIGMKAFHEVMDNYKPIDVNKFVTITEISIGLGNRGVRQRTLPSKSQKTRYAN